MSDTGALHKILDIKQQEKVDAQLQKQQATEKFEQIATKLYQKLSSKEQAESDFNQALTSHITIMKMKNQSLYISNMNKKIMELQHQVQIARNQMEDKQAKLTDAYMEEKKIEKLIELRVTEQKQRLQKQENQLMDDISIRQFVNANIN